jgi:hypothetical protein
MRNRQAILSSPRLRKTAIAALLAAPYPTVASACSVCFTASGQSLRAYYLVTVFLTLLPFLIGGGIYFALKRFSGKTDL